MTTAETITGHVEARNDRGIRVGGEWRNVSKFKPVDLPAIGAEVELGLDPKGFITTLEVLEGPATYSNLSDRQTTRLAVLQAAAGFAAGRELKSADVLRIADSWLAWVEAEA